MKGLVCKTCGYVALDGNKEVCPVCHMKNVFEEKEDAYKMPDFKAEKGESEKKHIPLAKHVESCGIVPETCCNVVHVKIGEITHPMTPEHFISELIFYHENKFMGMMMFAPDVSPVGVIHLKKDVKGKIQVIENCNLHGKWYNEIEIK